MEQNEIIGWLDKHIANLSSRYQSEQKLEKKISIGSRLRAFRDVLNLVKNQIKKQLTDAETESSIELLEEYFENRMDADDGMPNTEMNLYSEILKIKKALGFTS